MDPLSRLLRAARRGDGRALDAFVGSAYDQVWRLCAALVDEQGADDLAQETFARAVRALPAFRGEASARTWLLAIARNTCLDELRARDRRRRRQATLWASAGSTVPTTADASQDVTVFDLVGRLEPDRRTAFVLTQMVGLSYGEAARVCECPVGTIRSRVARARAELLDLVAAAETGRALPPAAGA